MLTRHYRRRLTARFETCAPQRNLKQIRREVRNTLQIAELPRVDAYDGDARLHEAHRHPRR